MKNEQIKAITDKLVLLSENQVEGVRENVELMIRESSTSVRERLFRAFENMIYETGDVNTSNEHGVSIGVGTNLIYNEAEDENVSLCYMYDDDALELHVNNEVVLKIEKSSPILEALKVLFDNYRLDEKIEY